VSADHVYKREPLRIESKLFYSLTFEKLITGFRRQNVAPSGHTCGDLAREGWSEIEPGEVRIREMRSLRKIDDSFMTANLPFSQ